MLLSPGRACPAVGEACQLLGPLVAVAGGRAVAPRSTVGLLLLGWNVIVEIVLRVLDAARRRLGDVVVVLPDCRVFRDLKQKVGKSLSK